MELNLDKTVQINDGFSQTSADGACLAFDSKYGIMFCAYMPGFQGHYGESRGKISLSYFPASQPSNIKYIDISSGNDEYLPNILSLGDGRVRVFYEKNSKAEGDHSLCFKDFDFLSGLLSEEKKVMVKLDDGSCVPYGLSVVFKYLEDNGFYNHKTVNTEQIGMCAMFKGDDGLSYGGAVSFLSEVVLYRSSDNMQTMEFFAIFPGCVQYEFEYRFLNDKIYAIYRTDKEENSIFTTCSSDGGKTWENPTQLSGSIQCRPRMLVYDNKILTAYNVYNDNTENRPPVQQGRTEVRLCLSENENPESGKLIAELRSKYGIVNICLCDILGDLYMAYSTSVLALEYQNGNPMVRGKDAIRYLKL